MSLAVVDASALVVFYLSDDFRRAQVVDRLGAGDALFAPAHLDLEVVSALRSLARGKPSLAEAVPGALQHLAAIPIRRVLLTGLVGRIWQLGDNITAYDGAYVALAAELKSPLITCDAKLVAAGGARCSFDLIS